MHGEGFGYDRRNVMMLSGLTYDEAEKMHAAGRLTDNGWTCFRVCWTLGAPRFSSLADAPRLLVHNACAQAWRDLELET